MAGKTGLNNPRGRRPVDKVRGLQRRLWGAAKRAPRRRFHALYDRIYRGDVLWEAWKRVRQNRGAAGLDAQTIAAVEQDGVECFIVELGDRLRAGKYRPQAVLRRYIPKADGRKRPLGIPTVTDRVVQMAAKLVLEPIFEADFLPCSYGFRPQRSALMALGTCASRERRAATMLEADIRNIFLHVLDTLWTHPSAPLGTLVRHADDFVIICATKRACHQAETRVRQILARLGLELHPEKTRKVNLYDGQKGFDLGCHLHKRMSGKIWEQQRKRLYFLHRWLSERALKMIREKVRERKLRGRSHADIRVVIADLDPVLRGWANDFRTGNAAKRFNQLDSYIWRRLRRLRWCRKGRHLKPGEANRWMRESFYHIRLGVPLGVMVIPA